jgi:DNA-binding HxlR family transcriptional regulator
MTVQAISYSGSTDDGLALEALIRRTRDPELRRAFEGMRSCPVRGRDGRCNRFTDYILGALIRNGCHYEYDIEDALQRIVFRMLSPVGETGKHRRTIFDFDESRPFDLRLGNPLEAIFKVYLNNEIRSIRGGKIPALRTRQRNGTLSIGYGTDTGEVSPDEIPARAASGEQEMLGDITELLRRCSTPDMPLADLFLSILKGEGTRTQRARFGHNRADMMRKIIVQTVQQYARQTQNWHLLRLLGRFQDFQGSRPDPAPKPLRPQKPPKPTYPPDEQDYRSIVDVLEKHGRSASMMILGKVRRRWLERPPRDPASVHPNRLADVLARMVADGVLVRQGARYVPGPRYARYLEPVAVG